MQVTRAGNKFNRMTSIILFFQVIMTTFNILFGLLVANQSYLYEIRLSGMLIRATIQAILMFWLVKRVRRLPKKSTVWWIFLCCLTSGFTNIFSSYTSLMWGYLELILIICGIALLFLYHSYIKAVLIKYEEKNISEQEE